MVTSSRDTLDWAAQQETPILTVDDVEAGFDSVEVNPQIYVVLAEVLVGEALDTVRGAGLEAWRKLVRRFDPQTVGRKRTLLSRILNPGTVKGHELSRSIEHIKTHTFTSTSLVCQITPTEFESRRDGHWQSHRSEGCVSHLWTARSLGRVSQAWQGWSGSQR